MNKKCLYILWAGLFSLCAGCGFIPEPEGTLRFVLTAVSVLLFLPPACLMYQAARQQDLHTAKLIRNLSALSLGLTLVLLLLNFFTAFASETLGQILHCMLTIVSSPMVCSGHWAMSLFLWACLLMASLKQCSR